MNLPKGYREGLPRSWGPWLDQLPELVASYLDRWELMITGELPLSHSYVVPVERGDGRVCVLKIRPTDLPDAGEARRELAGLRLGGPNAVVVVDHDVDDGALLLDRATPGTTLEEIAERDDDAATEALAEAIRDYGQPLDEPDLVGLRPFEDLAEVFEAFDRGRYGGAARSAAGRGTDARLQVILGMDELGTAVPAMRSARHTAERVMAELLVDHSPPYLLHGDLHHGNVLADEERGRVVVDPWGLYGDRSVDVAPALHNPLAFVSANSDVDSLVRRRLAIHAEVLELDEEHLTAWCYVYNVIRALWTLQDADEISETDAGVRTIAALRRLI